MKDYVKYCVFAVAGALVAFPVSGVAGLIGIVVTLVALAKFFGLVGKPRNESRQRRRNR